MGLVHIVLLVLIPSLVSCHSSNEIESTAQPSCDQFKTDPFKFVKLTLNSLGYQGQFEQNFIEHDITDDVVMEFDMMELEKIIPPLGKRKKFMLAFKDVVLSYEEDVPSDPDDLEEEEEEPELFETMEEEDSEIVEPSPQEEIPEIVEPQRKREEPEIPEPMKEEEEVTFAKQFASIYDKTTKTIDTIYGSTAGKVVIGAAVTVGAATVAVPAALGAAGFSAAGVVAGSTAAAVQATIGNVAGGSLFAWCQATASTGAMKFGSPYLAGLGLPYVYRWFGAEEEEESTTEAEVPLQEEAERISNEVNNNEEQANEIPGDRPKETPKPISEKVYTEERVENSRNL